MTIAALDIYDVTKSEQLGVNGVFTESAVYDPDGAAVTMYGIFDENTFRGAKSGGNVEAKKDGPRFITSEITFTFDVYADKKIYLPYRSRTYTIMEIDKDETGAQVIWLV